MTLIHTIVSELDILLQLKRAKDLFQVESKNIINCDWIEKFNDYFFKLDKRNLPISYNRNFNEDSINILNLIEKFEKNDFFFLYEKNPFYIKKINEVLLLTQSKEYKDFINVLKESKNLSSFNRLIDIAVSLDSFYLFSYVIRNYNISNDYKTNILKNILLDNRKLSDNHKLMVQMLLEYGADSNKLDNNIYLKVIKEGCETLFNCINPKYLVCRFNKVLNDYLSENPHEINSKPYLKELLEKLDYSKKLLDEMRVKFNEIGRDILVSDFFLGKKRKYKIVLVEKSNNEVYETEQYYECSMEAVCNFYNTQFSLYLKG